MQAASKFYQVLFYSHFYVIVKRWSGNEKEEDFRAIRQSDLKNFTNSNNGKEAYIAIRQNGYKSDMSIIIGDNTVTARRKRRSAPKYQNAPLRKDTRYAIFIRVFYDENGVSYILTSFYGSYA